MKSPRLFRRYIHVRRLFGRFLEVLYQIRDKLFYSRQLGLPLLYQSAQYVPIIFID